MEILMWKLRSPDTFEECKEEIIRNKGKYKPALLKLLELEEDIDKSSYKNIIVLWDKEWKEEANVYIDKLKFYYSDYYKIYLFKEYKEEIIKDKERYKLALLDIFEKNGYINIDIYKEIIELWDKEWKEKPNVEVDKLKFSNKYPAYIFEKYKKEIGKNKERYKPVLLELLKEEKINKYKEIIELWEKDWEEKPIINLDKWKFYYGNIVVNIFSEYKEEIKKNKDRYKPILLELLEENEIDSNIYKEIVDIWDKEWKEKGNIYIDKIKFKDNDIFSKYKEEIGKDKERYKPVFLELLEKNEISYRIYKEIVELWEREWKEKGNIYIDKIKFYNDDIFKKYKEEIKGNKEKYKPILLELLEENKIDSNIYKEIVELWEREWKEKANIYIDKIKFYNDDIFYEYEEEIEKNKERYKPALLEVLDENKLSNWIDGKIIELWEKKWEEEPNVNIDKLVFWGWSLYEDYEDCLNDYEEGNEDYDEQDIDDYNQALLTKNIIDNPKRYKPALLKMLEENINGVVGDLTLCPSVVELWEWEWKEEQNIEIDKMKFYNEDLLYDFRDEIINNPERYKPVFLETLEDKPYVNMEDYFYLVYSDIVNKWEDDD